MNKKIKRIIIFLIIVTVLLAMNSYSYAASGKPGETVKVTYTITSPDGANLDTVTGKLTYDSSILEYVSISTSAGKANNATVSATRDQIGGTSMTVTAEFKIKNGVGDTTTTTALNLSELYTTASENNQKKTISASVTVKTPVDPKPEPEPETPTTPQEPQNPTTPQQPQTPEKPKELEFKKVDETVYTTKSVNIRDSYGLSSNVKETLEEGTSVKRIGVSTSSADGYKWSKIIYNGKTYYAVSSMLTTTEPKKTEKEPEKTVEQEEPVQEPTEEPEDNKEVTTVEQGEGLKELNISGIELEPGFSTNVFEYTAKLTADVNTLQIETTATSEKYKVVVAGNENLVDGENLITIIVYDEKSNVVAIYQITVIKSAVNQDEIESILANIAKKETIRKIALNSVLVLIIVLILIYIAVYVKAAKIKKKQKAMQREERVFEENISQEETFEDNFEENIISESVMEQNEEINRSFKTVEKKKGKHF